MSKKLLAGLLVLCVICVGVSADVVQKGVVEPKAVMRTITVGGAGADISGFTSRALQIAADALTAQGGGVIRMSPGTFEITGPVRLGSDTAIIGSGDGTILRKCAGYSSPLAIEAGYGLYEFTVKDASGFKVGMGVQIYDDASGRSWNATAAKIIDIEDNTLYLDNHTRSDYKVERNATVSNACSIVEAVGAERVRMANFVVDGNIGANPDIINGCIGGGVYLHKVKMALVQDVKVQDFNGDGFSWQLTEDVMVRGGRVTGSGNIGFHPGSGSVRTIVEGCNAYRNKTIGLFVCWRVKDGRFINNSIYENGRDGISIGHKDTDNVFEGNFINENGRHGVNFRDESETNGGHRNRIANNIIQNNGTKEEGYGIHVGGATYDIVIENNKIRDLGGGSQKAGIYIGPLARNIKVENNQIEGHAEGDVIDKSAKQD